MARKKPKPKVAKDLLEALNGLGGRSGAEAGVDWYIDSGCYTLNWMISGDAGRGYPGGKVVELFGEPSTGKTLLMYHIIAEAQRVGGVCALDDVEDSHEPAFAAKVGVDNKALRLFNSATVEEHYELLQTVPRKIREYDKHCPIVVALDSLAELSTRAEMEKGFDKEQMKKPKLVKQGLRMTKQLFGELGVLYVVTNHVISTFNRYGSPKTTPGGRGVPFHASVRIELSRPKSIGDVKEGTRPPVGVTMQAVARKNKVSAPLRSAQLAVYFDRGIDRHHNFLKLLQMMGVVELRGSWLFFGDLKFKRAEFKEFLAEHNQALYKALREATT